MTRHLRLTVPGAIAALTLVVPVSTQRGASLSRTREGPRKNLLFLAQAGRAHIKGRIRWTLGLE